MSRPNPTAYRPIPAIHLAFNRAIHEGSKISSEMPDGVARYGELDLAENVHWLHTNLTPSVVNNVFVNNGYIVGASTSYALRALWQRRPYVDCTDWEIRVLAENTGAGTSGYVKFEMASDSANVEIEIPTTSTQWTTHTGRVTYDNTQTIDTIEMWVKNGSLGAVRVHSVEIRPYLGTIAAGVTAAGFIPHDTEEFSADDPCTVYNRAAMRNNLEVLRKTRGGSIVGWSEDVARAIASQWSTTSATYETVLRLPWKTTFGQTALEWALTGYVGAAGTGSVKLEVLGDVVDGGTQEREVTLGTTWTSPYTAAQYSFNDGGSGVLEVPENSSGELRVSLKGDGTRAAYLMGLSVWPEDAA